MRDRPSAGELDGDRPDRTDLTGTDLTEVDVDDGPDWGTDLTDRGTDLTEVDVDDGPDWGTDLTDRGPDGPRT